MKTIQTKGYGKIDKFRMYLLVNKKNDINKGEKLI